MPTEAKHGIFKPVPVIATTLISFLIASLSLLALEPTPKAPATPRLASQHWAFQRPEHRLLPQVQNVERVRNSIDAFVLNRLEKENIQPAPEADRRTLIRRLSFDLLGLPPEPEDVEAFVADLRTDAYEKLVDRLLASPHFGERWGRHWLDLARYADSDGYEKDTSRPYAYLYRDWVIDAINRDLPFDQFSIEQLAGDLLPDATMAQKIATGFHRNTLTNKEGGVDQEEFRCKATVDRVSTTGTVWLGLTVGCAECHSHKYDPITQREFYQLYAFFNNASEKDLPAPQPAELASYNDEKRSWDAEHARVKKALSDYLQTEISAKQAEWERNVKLPRERWTVLKPVQASSAEGATLKILEDRSVQATDKNPARDTYTIEASAELTSVTGFRLEILNDPAPGKGSGRTKSNNFVLSEFTVKVQEESSASQFRSVALQNVSADYAPKDWPAAGAIDGNPKTGWAIGPEIGRHHVAVFETKESLTFPKGAALVFQLEQQYGDQRTIGHFRLSVTDSENRLRADLTPDSIIAALETSLDLRDEKQKTALAKYYRDAIDPTAKQLDRQLANHTKKEPKFPETKAQTISENEQPRRSHIHIRGDFLRKGDEVEPGSPAILHAFKARGHQADRLDLARWLFDTANPLTARVAVNRIWYHLFGRGLVTTMDDFGTRGEAPSHPRLLDWLATEFPRLGWSRKALIQLIVTSSTYRQSSVWRSDLIERDPNNLLLASQNRFRLEAETVRDACLAVGGLLNPSVGGPSTRPPLPADIAALGYANSVKWKASEGAEKFRRGLYIFFQRTVPYPMLVTFDAPDSNATCTRRERSNTPLQALTLLNDPVFFECAQALGTRMASHKGSGSSDKLKCGFALCLGRGPTDEELRRLETLYQDYVQLAKNNPQDAARIVGIAGRSPSEMVEAAALVALGRTMLNLDEFLTRE